MRNRCALVVMVVIFILSGCSSNKKEITPTLLEVNQSDLDAEQTVTVKRGTVEDYLLLDGMVVPKVYQIGFEEQGKFGEYKVELGDTVTKGQVLAVLDGTKLNENIEKFTRELENIIADYECELECQDKLIESYKTEIAGYKAKMNDKSKSYTLEEYEDFNVDILKKDLDVKREEVKKEHIQQRYDLDKAHAQSQLTQETAKRGKMNIVSPCDGEVIAIQGASRKSETRDDYYYIAVAEKDSYYVQSDYVTQAYIENLKEVYAFRNGKNYALTYEPLDEKVYIEMLNNEEEKKSSFKINNIDSDITYGAKMKVKYTVKSIENVLIVPNNTIVSDKSGKFVYRKTADGMEKVMIKLGSMNKINTEVKSGLQEGDVIYVQK